MDTKKIIPELLFDDLKKIDCEVEKDLVPPSSKRGQFIFWSLLFVLSCISAFCSTTNMIWADSSYLTVNKSGFLSFSGSKSDVKTHSVPSTMDGTHINSDDIKQRILDALQELYFPANTNGGIAMRAKVWGYVLLPDTKTRLNGVYELYLSTSLGVIHYSGSEYYFLNESNLNAAVYLRKASLAAAAEEASSLTLGVENGRKLDGSLTSNCIPVLTSYGFFDENGHLSVHDFYDSCADGSATVDDLNGVTLGNITAAADGNDGLSRRKLDTTVPLSSLKDDQMSSLPVQTALGGPPSDALKLAGVSLTPFNSISIVVGDQIVNISTPLNVDALSDAELAQHVSKVTKINPQSLAVVDPNNPPAHLAHLKLQRWKLSRVVHAVAVVVKKAVVNTVKNAVKQEIITAVGDAIPGVNIVVAAYQMYQMYQAVKTTKQTVKNIRHGRILSDDSSMPSLPTNISSPADIKIGGFVERSDFIFHPVDTPCIKALEWKLRHAMVGNRPPALMQLSKVLSDGTTIVLENTDMVCLDDDVQLDTITTDGWKALSD